jgi:hypothetical protein
MALFSPPEEIVVFIPSFLAPQFNMYLCIPVENIQPSIDISLMS